MTDLGQPADTPVSGPIQLVPLRPAATPRWVESDLEVTNGRDPLGLEAIATYRIMPQLLPAILELSRRARYFSFFAYLIDEFARRYSAGTMAELDRFVRQAEYEFGFAVFSCSQCHGEGRGVLGEVRLRPARRAQPPLLRRELSVDTPLGGYGLFYRRPIEYLGLLAAAGTKLEDGRTLGVDRLANSRARFLADRFREAVAGTRWATDDLGGSDEIPRDHLIELAGAACLCRLSTAPRELAALADAFMNADDGAPAAVRADASLREKAFSHFLLSVRRDPGAATSAQAWRQTLWSLAMDAEHGTSLEAESAAAWGAFAGREFERAALGVLWHSVCRLGRLLHRDRGLTHGEFLEAVRTRLATETTACGVPSPGSAAPTVDLAAAIESTLGNSTLDAIVETAQRHQGALDALAILLELNRRLPAVASMPTSWHEIGRIDGEHQDGLLAFAAHLDAHLGRSPTVADTLAWLVDRYILRPHDRVATSKLPRHAFRFRYDSGRLFFFDTPSIDIGDGMLRHEALAMLTRDLDLWAPSPGGGMVTAAGNALIARAFRS